MQNKRHQEIERRAERDNEVSLPMIEINPRPRSEHSGANISVTKQSLEKKEEIQYDFAAMKSADVATEEQPAPTGMLAWVGFGCCVFGLACLCIAFASPYWMQAWPNSSNQFRNLGLWQVCFQDYMHHKDDSQEIYNGCWWVFNTATRYSKLREWLLPPWFISCQVMVVGTLLLEIGTAAVIALIFLHCCPLMNHEYLQTYWMFTASAMMFLATLITLITSIIFGVKSQDRYWMPRPDLSFISWGFGFFIISGIMTAASGAAFFYQGWLVYKELLSRELAFNKAALEMSAYPMSQSGYAPTYPSVGDMSYSKQSLGTQPSYEGQQSYDGKQSYATQPSFDGKQSYGTQPSYDGRENYTTQPAYDGKQSYTTQPGYDGRESYATQPGYDGRESYATQSGYDGRPSYSDQDYYDQQKGAWPAKA